MDLSQGAVDNTAGTATVMEIARQFGILHSELGDPKMTVYFCTWGGEEEGLWGSKEWVDKHRDDLAKNLRLYINLDMNHVDAERNSGVVLQGNSKTDVNIAFCWNYIISLLIRLFRLHSLTAMIGLFAHYMLPFAWHVGQL